MVSTRGRSYDTPTTTTASASEATPGKRSKNEPPKPEKTKKNKYQGLGPESEREREKSPTPQSPVRVARPQVMANPLDAMMAPRGPPIVMPQALAPRAMPSYFPKFGGLPHEDPSTHIERYIEVMLANVIAEDTYKLVWFSTTLEGIAYEWYRSHDEGTFRDWRALQTAFLRQFRPEMGQQSALVALTNMRQGPSEGITSYIRRFETVVTRYVGTLLTNDTIKFYFIQGFNKQGTIREILNSNPQDLEEAKAEARRIEGVDKQNERMWNCTIAPVPAFLPTTYIPPEQSKPPQLEPSRPDAYAVHRAAPVPLATRPPPELLALPSPPSHTTIEELELRVKKANDELRSDVMQSLKTLTEQLTMAITSRPLAQPVPPASEAGNYGTNIWCRNCNKPGHSNQFCTEPRFTGNLVAPPPRPQQGHSQTQARNNGKGVCPTCGKVHILGPGKCWIETGVVCNHCGGNHPVDNCRRILTERPSHYSQLNQQLPALFYDRNQQNQGGMSVNYHQGNLQSNGQQNYGPPNHQNQGNRGNNYQGPQNLYPQNPPAGGRQADSNLVGMVSQQYVPQMGRNQPNRFNNGPQVAQQGNTFNNSPNEGNPFYGYQMNQGQAYGLNGQYTDNPPQHLMGSGHDTNQQWAQNMNGPPTSQGPLNLGHAQTQDARFIDNNRASTSCSAPFLPIPNDSHSNFISHELADSSLRAILVPPKKLKQKIDVAVVTRAQKRAQTVMGEGSEKSNESEKSPKFAELPEFLQNAALKAKVPTTSLEPNPDDEPVEEPFLEEEEDLFRFVDRRDTWGNGLPANFPPKPRPSRAFNPAEDYDLWSDLCSLRANISLAQLIQVAPALRKEFKEGATQVRKAKIPTMAVEVRRTPLGDEGPIEVEVEIMDKIIPHTLVDGGSGINIMPLSTLEKLGLELTGPSPFVINVADQRQVTPLGQVKDCLMKVGGEVYTITFQVLRLPVTSKSYPILLGRDWLRRANATTEWSTGTSQITFGPPHNRTTTRIALRKPSTEFTESDLPKSKPEPNIVSVDLANQTLGTKTHLGPVKDMGPGLYGWEDTGEFTAWMELNPEEIPNHTQVYAITATEDTSRGHTGFVLIADDLPLESIYSFEIDGTQPIGLEDLVLEEYIVPSLHFKNTSTGIQVGHDFASYPSVPNDWYKGPTNQMPFALVYGIEAVLPIELEIPSLRIAVDSRLTVAESLSDRLLMLESRSERRRASVQHLEAMKRRRKAVFNKRHKVRTLQPGTSVMLQDARKLEFPGKSHALWLGPFWVTNVYDNNSVQLATLDGTYFPTRTNGGRCKLYNV